MVDGRMENLDPRKAVAAAPGVLVVDAQGAVLFVNAAFERLTGLAAAHVRGAEASIVAERLHAAAAYVLPAPADLREAIGEDRTEVLSPASTMAAFGHRSRIFFTGAAPRVLEVDVERCGGGGAARVLTFRDVSAIDSGARRHADFLARASHAARTPLGAVVGFAQLLAEKHSIAGEDHELATLLAQDSRRLAQLLDDVFELARIGALGEHAFAFERASVRALVEETVRGWRQARAEPALEVIELPAPLVTVWADAARLRKTIERMLASAAAVTAPGGRIALRARKRVDGASPSVAIETVDPGPCPQGAELDAAFDPLDTGASARAQGAARRGLALAREVARWHAGSVQVHAAPEGTVVSLVLPGLE
jgi:signal transduction histidine kinase